MERLIFYTAPKSIKVGRPWGQFQGLANLDKLMTSFFISACVKDCPTFVASLQALIAQMAVNLSIRVSYFFSETMRLKYSIPNFWSLNLGQVKSFNSCLFSILYKKPDSLSSILASSISSHSIGVISLSSKQLTCYSFVAFWRFF